MRRFLKYAGRFFSVLSAAFLFYWLLLVFPQIFFRLEKIDNLYLYHHSEPEKVRAVGERALTKIKNSTLYNPNSVYRVFMTDSVSEYAFYTSLWRNSGGVFLIFANGNIFIRPAVIEQDRLIAPSGELVAEDRPLNYFIAHEAAHAMTYEKIGFSRYLALEEWVREGVADKIARDRFHFDEMLENYRRELPVMDRRKSGLYLKQQLLVEFALRFRNYDAERLLQENPNEAEMESELKKLSK